MIFSVGIGSEGANEESYTLRIPLETSPVSDISLSTDDTTLMIGDHRARIFREQYFYVLEVYGFSSEVSARHFLPKLGVGLVWVRLQHRMAFVFNLQPTPIHYYEPPSTISESSDFYPVFSRKGWKELDGYYYNNQTVIKPEHKRLAVWTMGRPRIISSIRDQDLARKVSEMLTLLQAARVFGEPKLILASEIYTSSFFESSRNARFLALVMVLEALKTDAPVAAPVKDTIKRLHKQAKETRNSLGKDDPSYEDFNHFLSRLGNLKNRSIGQGIRSLITERLQLDPNIDDAAAVADEVSDIYDLRSTLLHTGTADDEAIEAAVIQLDDVVPRVLSITFSQVVGDL
jgi:hypothetical protein